MMTHLSDKLGLKGVVFSLGFGILSYITYGYYNKKKEIEDKVELPELNFLSDDQSDTSAISERVEFQDNRISLLESKVSAMASHEQRISSLAVRVSEMQDYGQRIFQTESNTRENNKIIKKLEERVLTLENKCKDLELSIKEQNKRISSVEIEKPTYTFFNKNPNINGVLNTVEEPGVILFNNKTKD
jgi:hypothetical protein